jgi:hypothetical protein
MFKIGFAAFAAAVVAIAPSVATAQSAGDAPSATTGAVTASTGKTLYFSTGQRLGLISRVNAAGDPQVIYDGQLVTVPVATLSDVGGKLTTSVLRKDVGRNR